jgi:carbon-monoxide dehydrogenase large subunit
MRTTKRACSGGRAEDALLLGAKTRFIADLEAEGMLQCAFVRSAVAHGRIRVQVPPASACVTVLTAAELGGGMVPSIHGHAGAPRHLVEWSELRQAEVHQPLLALDRVLYVGQPVALVVADDRYAAEDAADEVVVEYEELPAVVSAAAALQPSSAALSEQAPGNCSVEFRLRTGTPPGSEAPLESVTETFFFGRQTGAPIENRGILAVPDPGRGRLTVWSATQIPHALREAIAEVLAVPVARIRVVVPAVGGSFGTKGVVSAEELAVISAAVRLGRPLRWLEDRYESLCGAIQARDQVHHITLRADTHGRLRSLEDQFLVDVGAYDPFGKSVPYNTAAHVPGPYHIPHLHIRGRSVLTNKTPAAPYRGSGRPEAHFARERAIDRLARRLRIDPMTLRERNLVTREEMPYRTGLLYRDGASLVYDGFDMGACLAAARTAMEEFPHQSGSYGRLRRGRGVACYVATSGMGPYERARVQLTGDGKIAVVSGASSQGQSHMTAFAKLVSDAMGVAMDDVVVAQGDTDLLQDGWGTMASRSVVAAGNAIVTAARRLRFQLDRLSETLAISSAALPRGAVPGRQAVLSLVEVAKIAREAGYERELTAEGVFEPPTVTWGCGVHVATVEVDVGLRAVRILDYVAAYDHGPLVDPFAVTGQMEGAIAQGIGSALCEEVLYDDNGQPTSLTLADYVLPTARVLPSFRVLQAAASPSPSNPLGLRGLGEAGTVAPPAAIANAVEDALAHDGVRIDRVPLTAERLHRALSAAGL